MSLAPDTSPGTPIPRRDRVRFAGSSIGSTMVLVTVDGELDAANALALSGFVEAYLESTRQLIVDLRALEFFGTQGFSTLHRINVMCSRHEVDWVLISGSEVDRLLRICDPDGGLPVTATLDEAIAAAVRPPRSHLWLVSGT